MVKTPKENSKDMRMEDRNKFKAMIKMKANEVGVPFQSSVKEELRESHN